MKCSWWTARPLHLIMRFFHFNCLFITMVVWSPVALMLRIFYLDSILATFGIRWKWIQMFVKTIKPIFTFVPSTPLLNNTKTETTIFDRWKLKNSMHDRQWNEFQTKQTNVWQKWRRRWKKIEKERINMFCKRIIKTFVHHFFLFCTVVVVIVDFNERNFIYINHNHQAKWWLLFFLHRHYWLRQHFSSQIEKLNEKTKKC